MGFRGASTFRSGLVSTVLVGVFAIVVGGVAQAAPRVSVDTVFYDVKGDDARELVSYMLRHGPGGASGRALGTTSAVLRHDGDFSGEERCRVLNYRVELELTIRLPRLASGQRLSGTLRRQWNSFASHVQRHENTHKTIYQRCARRIEQRVRALNGTLTCRALNAQMRRVFNEENQRCDQEHARFDADETNRIRNLPLIVRASRPAQQQTTASQSRQTDQAARPTLSRADRPSREDLR